MPLGVGEQSAVLPGTSRPDNDHAVATCSALHMCDETVVTCTLAQLATQHAQRGCRPAL